MYELRMKYEKGTPMNLIAKLLINSLYGKFGMKLVVTRVDIFDVTNELSNKHLRSLMKQFGETIHDYIKIDNNIFIVRDSLAPSIPVQYSNLGHTPV